MLFVTPFVKRSGEIPNEISATDYNVVLGIDNSNELKIKPLRYWPNKPSKEILGARTWDKKKRVITLGSQDLKLSILKPNERSNVKNKSILLEKMKQIRNIPAKTPVDLHKVTLGAKFDNYNNLKSSKVILDKSRFLIEPIECSTRTICTRGM